MIERVYDESRIAPIVMQMMNDATEDGTMNDCFNLDVMRDCWLSCDDYSALFHVAAFNRTALDLHCYVPESNRANGQAYAREAISWINESAPAMYKKIITQVPSVYRHINLFVRRLGFTPEGAYKNAFTKNGERYDLNIFGLERRLA